MPASEHEAQPPRAVSMRDLLAAGAAANAVSTPPNQTRPATGDISDRSENGPRPDRPGR